MTDKKGDTRIPHIAISLYDSKNISEEDKQNLNLILLFSQARLSPRSGRGTEQEKVKNKFAIQWNGGVFDID